MDRAELCNENNCSIKGARDVGGEGRGGTARREGEGGGREGGAVQSRGLSIKRGKWNRYYYVTTRPAPW